MKLYSEIYIPMEELEPKEKDFYVKFYQYKAFCNKHYKQQKNYNFKKEAFSQNLIKELNKSYLEMIDSNTEISVEHNQYNELNYPSVSYRYDKDSSQFFICIDNSAMRAPIDIGEVLPILPLYKDSEILSKTLTGSTDQITIKTTLNKLLSTFRENYKSYAEKKYLIHIVNFIKTIDVFPQNSICELNLKDFFKVDEIRGCLNEI